MGEAGTPWRRRSEWEKEGVRSMGRRGVMVVVAGLVAVALVGAWAATTSDVATASCHDAYTVENQPRLVTGTPTDLIEIGKKCP